jgi:4-hydroxy-tetrahydrodipicolinate synthase
MVAGRGCGHRAMNREQPGSQNTCRCSRAASNIAAPYAGSTALPLAGSLTALVTPFAASGALDLDAFARLIDDQLAGGTQGLVVAGSTGEAAALSPDEYSQLIATAVRQVRGRVPVLAGSGQSSTAATIAQTQRARDAGAEFALVVTPPYVRPTQAGLVAHYRAVAAEGGLPVVLYNVPGRTGCDMAPETVAALQAVPGIVGIKEANAAPGRIAALVAHRTPGFAVLSGDDPSAVAAMRAGADGLISVASNAAPAAMAHALAQRQDDARLDALIGFCGVEPNPIPIKAVLAAMGMIEDRLRLPLLPLAESHRATAQALARDIAAHERSLRAASP